MGNNKNKKAEPAAQDEKIVTRYDRKVQRRKEEARKEAARKRLLKAAAIVIAAAAVIGIAAWLWIDYDKVHREYIAVDGDSISGIEFDFYYGVSKQAMLSQNLYGIMSYKDYFTSYLGYNADKKDSKQKYSEDSGQTWFDYFAALAVATIKEDKAILKIAEDRGYEYTDGDSDYEEFAADIAEAAEQEQMSVKEYYKEYYGSHATEKNIKSYIMEYLKAKAFQDKLREELAASEDEIKAYYEEHKDDYDTVDYRVFEIEAEEADDEASMAQAKETADEFASKVTSEGDFIAFCKDYSTGEEKEKYEQDDDASKVTAASKSSMSTDLADWMFDGLRKEGDVNVIEDTANGKYTIVYFIHREYEQSNDDAIADVLLSQNYSDLVTPYMDEMKVKNPFNRIRLLEG